ncbi:MAG: hypothetical protein FJ147_17185 [Deltaproteobacteria bacterium]|nr:hypothetical protein [Deltaproteobacteria bacterium]
MLEQLTVEERLSALEKELKELKQQVTVQQEQRSWIEKIAGTFKDDPDFEEIVRLGREFRKAAQ